MKRLDARGLSCPEPVVMLQKAMVSQEKAYEMVLDSRTATENVTRYAQHQGYQVLMSEQEGYYTLAIAKK